MTSKSMSGTIIAHNIRLSAI